MTDPTTRFSNRVDDYVKYRPSYPRGVLDILRKEAGLTAASVVLDVGSGTGISSKMFLENGNRVFGVEPNAPMREAAERVLADYTQFTSVNGTAEETTLPNASVDLAVAGQAFHWFDPVRARVELIRVLREPKERRVCLLWNDRKVDDTPFLREYDALLHRLGTDYAKVNHKNVQADDSVVGPFFSGGYAMHKLPNEQRFDFDGLRGRVMSSSYVPAPGEPNHEPLMRALRELFDRRNENGEIVFLYETKIYVGALTKR